MVKDKFTIDTAILLRFCEYDNSKIHAAIPYLLTLTSTLLSLNKRSRPSSIYSHHRAPIKAAKTNTANGLAYPQVTPLYRHEAYVENVQSTVTEDHLLTSLPIILKLRLERIS